MRGRLTYWKIVLLSLLAFIVFLVVISSLGPANPSLVPRPPGSSP